MLIDNYDNIISELEYLNDTVNDFRFTNSELFNDLYTFTLSIKENTLLEYGSSYIQQIPDIITELPNESYWNKEWNRLYGEKHGNFTDEMAERIETLFLWNEFKSIFSPNYEEEIELTDVAE